ncbi:hypothetical protein ANCCEY_09489 [Ancylostoma ceylanicum]|uniref:G-protein coupled receptors family 1 profile domain-containing protein n=1 Tax=Ancylostoma ceylanicum TaxID=53326 RepID=A0A0D6LN28_9BILA|nr:hypothetical protein ANCCEY_09489 [Ancylostoma ceylanicum]
MEDDYRVSKYCVVIEIIIFNIVGNFGNVHLIWTSIRKKSTHTKPGMLLGVNAVFHIVCLVSELFNAAFLLSGEPIVRRVCYPYMVVYIYTICQQAVMILMISLDLLISLLFPFWHRKFPTIPYVIGMIALSSVYSFTVAIWGWKAKDDGIIPFCNPPLSNRTHKGFVLCALLPPIASALKWALQSKSTTLGQIVVFNRSCAKSQPILVPFKSHHQLHGCNNIRYHHMHSYIQR